MTEEDFGAVRKRLGISWLSVFRNVRKLIREENFEAISFEDIANQLIKKYYPDAEQLDKDLLAKIIALIIEWLPFILTIILSMNR